MSIWSVLRHRATVRRSVRTFEDGRAQYGWTTIGTSVPVLLDATKPEKGEQEEIEGQRADRQGLLLSAQSADLKPGDHLVMTRGPAGTFRIESDPDERPSLNGISHREFSVVEVA